MDHLPKIKRKINPIEKSGFLSQLFYVYTLKLFNKGYKKELEENDLYETPSFLKTKKLGDTFEKILKQQGAEGRKPSIVSLLLKCHGLYYFFLGLSLLIIKTALMCIRNLRPFLMGKFVSFFAAKGTNLIKTQASLYAFTFLLVLVSEAIYDHWYALSLGNLELRVRAAFTSIIYRKCLKLSRAFVEEISIGKILTLITKDVYNFEVFIGKANEIWIGIVQVLVVFYFLYKRIGLMLFFPLIIYAVISPVQIYVALKTKDMKMKMFKDTDKRLQATKEVLLGIRTVKMYTWESFFKAKLYDLRRKEVVQTWKIFLINLIATNNAYYIYLATFLPWLLVIKALGHDLNPETIYFIYGQYISLNHLLVSKIPLAIFQSAQAVATVKRIDKFLGTEEIGSSKKWSKESSISINNVSVAIKNETVLHNINVNFSSGLTLVTGAVGSGKTSLLKTVLGEYPPMEGKLEVKGTMSYASQEPWLFPSTIKQNILFGEEFDEERYNQVLDICALVYDLNRLQNGDETFVESQGLNLSKGQRVRINLARAVYKRSDTYLFDDPLAALDVRVKKQIFEKCIVQFLQNKLILLATQDLTFLEKSPGLIALSSGRIVSFENRQCVEKEMLPCIPQSIVTSEAMSNETENEDDLLLEKSRRNIYGESKKKGQVSYEVYKRWIKSGGGFIYFIFVTCLLAAPLISLKFTQTLLNSWVTNAVAIANYTRFNLTVTPEFEKMLHNQQNVVTGHFVLVSLLFVLFLVAFTVFTLSFKRVSIKLHESLLEAVLNGKIDFLLKHHIGNILNRFSKDLINTDEILPDLWFGVYFYLFPVIGAFIIIISLNKFFFMPIILLLVILYLLRKVYLSAARSLKRLETSTKSPLVGYFEATISGLITIRVRNVKDALREECDSHQDLYISASFTALCLETAFSLWVHCLCIAFTAVLMGYFLVVNAAAGNVGVGTAQTLILASILKTAIVKWSQVENYMTSVERIFEYVDNKQENKQGVLAENWPKFGEVKYENVFVSNSSLKEPILKNLYFVINSKEKVGIVGRTGAGKSSLLSALFRLYDFEGKIFFHGVDTKTLPLDWLRTNISVVPQDPLIFKGTIRENMDPLRKHSDLEIWSALETVNLKNFVLDLDMEIDDEDSVFSLGRKQLLCLARILIDGKDVVVVDEATANVDRETEILIYDLIWEKFWNRTVLMVSHSLEMLSRCDKIMVLDKGEIIEFDTPTKLSQNRNGAFYGMMQNCK